MSRIATLTPEGLTLSCAKNDHGVCRGADGQCVCTCHTADAQAQLTPGQKAARTRRANGGRSATGETAPKRPELKSGAKAVIPAAAAKQLKSEFALLIWGADGIVAGARPELWKTPEDRLTEGEINGLTVATYNEMEARCPALLKILAKAQESAPEAALLYTVAMIAIPRLARREAVVLGVKITPEFARAVVFAPLVFAQQAAQQSAASGVESVATSVGYRPDGDRQEHAGGVPVEGAPVQAGAAEQAGQRDVRHGQGYPNGAWNAGYAP
jgi:hypothetical protein